jgi:hypothetical protein
MSSTFEQHVDELPSTSQDTNGKKKSRVKFLCQLCRGSHQTHFFPHMEEASKLLEDMTVSQPQLPAAYRKLTLDPLVVDGMINLVPLLISSVDHVVNMNASIVGPVDKVVNSIPSSVDPTLSLESETQAVNPLPIVDPILPFENETQVVDLMSLSVDPTLMLESKSDFSQFFSLIQNLPCLGEFLPLLRNPLQVMRQNQIYSTAYKALGYPHLVWVTQTLFTFNRRTSHLLGVLPQFPINLGGKTIFIDVVVVEDPLDLDLLLG